MKQKNRFNYALNSLGIPGEPATWSFFSFDRILIYPNLFERVSNQFEPGTYSH
jgi:hypothetical protein